MVSELKLDKKPFKKGSKYSQVIIDQARGMWLTSVPVSVIVEELGLNNSRIVYQWRDKFEWHLLKPPESVLLTTSREFNRIMSKEDKSKQDWFALDKMADLMLKLEKAEAFKRGEWVGTGRSPGVKNGQGGNKNKKRKKNDVSDITEADFKRVFEDILYPHQNIWILAGENELTRRVRFILKSRQIGATFTFALEAFRTACLTGNDQIFLSSTVAQAEVFKSFIRVIAFEQFGVEIAGNPITLSNQAQLHFLSPNAFADSRSGDVYFDECFKTRNWKKMEGIAQPMATLSKFKKTYFSSPTAKSHEAYEIWDGSRYTNYHKDVVIDIEDHKALVRGRKDEDGIWRNVMTVHDAIELGWDLVDLDQLHMEMPDPALFAVTYECKFIDDADSVFKLNDLLNCGVERSLAWLDFDPDDDKPYGELPVTTGYDPAGEGDNASFVVLSKPEVREEKFRLFQSYNWRGIRAPRQCDRIEGVNSRYNIEYMEIDNTGPGIFVGDFVEDIFPQVVRITYNPDYKGRMVQKALSVIDEGRFEYDVDEDHDLPLHFLTVNLKYTDDGRITYRSSRNKLVGHGDKAWAIMHAFMCEKFNPGKARRFSFDVYP